MTNNFNYIYKCSEYGIDKSKGITIDEHIILKGKRNVILDSDYNVIGITDSDDMNSVHYYSKLSKLKLLPFPFDNYSLSDIMNLSKRFIVFGDEIIINGIKVSELDKDYDKVIKFIIYLNKVIQDVFHNYYNGKSSISIFEYLKVHINTFNSTHKCSYTKVILEELLCLLKLDKDTVNDRLQDEYDIPYDTLPNILSECKSKELKLTGNN